MEQDKIVNTWPGGRRHAMNQCAHEKWNASHYPGTRQTCSICNEPTGNCEEDSIHVNDEPVCTSCYLQAAQELVSEIEGHGSG